LGDTPCPNREYDRFVTQLDEPRRFATLSTLGKAAERGEREVASMMRVIRGLTAVAMLAAIVLIGVGQGPAQAEVTEVEGSAYGYFSNVSLFGGPPSTRGPAPTVTLPPGGSAVPITATAPTGSATYGPATIFSSGQLNVITRGTTGSTGYVTSKTNVQSVNTSGQEVFTADSVASTCIATEADTSSGSTTITTGSLQVSEGDPNVEGDETVIQVPTNPAPNTTYEGVYESTGDSFRYVFNEQIVDPNDGSIAVNAAHQYLLGPVAVGDLIVGQSVCGVTATTTPTGITPPKVVRTAPTANATGIAPGTNVSAFFSEAMRAGSINGNTVKLFKVGTTTAIGATVTYDAANKKAILNPNANLQRGAKYKVVVTTAARDLAGNQLDQDPNATGNQPKVWFFTVAPDTTAPKVSRVNPTENATGIAPSTNVSAFFSEAMRAGSINKNTVKIFKTGTTTAIGATVTYDAANKKAILNPNANLQRGAKYKAVVTTGVRDLAGNQLDQNLSVTGNQPKVWFFRVRN
jgi:hypothetical protein